MHIRLLAVLLAGVALAAAQAPAPAPALATPLPLPADPAVTCTAEAMLEVTSSVQECSDAIMDGEESGGWEPTGPQPDCGGFDLGCGGLDLQPCAPQNHEACPKNVMLYEAPLGKSHCRTRPQSNQTPPRPRSGVLHGAC